ncbi:MAG: tRNA 2-thiouridine(34) synthase MnmA [Dehalococcoidia bacterium]
MERKRVIVAMSGGVDSATAAALLVRQGYEVIGITMRLWTLEDYEAPMHQRRCCSVEDTDDAHAVCQVLGIPHYALNLEREFREYVVDYFCQEHQRGRTPNPCLACNEHIKFRPLLAKALALEADYLATGHYVRVVRGQQGYELRRARDASKDQSYVLYMLGQAELSRLLFPVGDYTKGEIRRIAAAMGLPVADKPDSADICFIPDGDYRAFVAQYAAAEPGEMVDSSGRLLGQHDGISGYTIGQRRGLGIAAGEPLYVVDICSETNTVVVGPEEELLVDLLWAEEVSFVAGAAPVGPLRVEAKSRYRSGVVPAVLTVTGDRAELRPDAPVRAVSPGQAVVFYQGDKVLGGGIIAAAGRRTQAVTYVSSNAQP